MSNSRREFWLIGISFFMIYVVWGSTYLANAWGVLHVPPFIYASFRFIFAGLLLYVFACVTDAEKLTKLQVRNTIIAGFLLFAIGNGLVTWALKYVDSGIASLIVAFQPLVVVFLMWSMRSKKPNVYSWIGVFIGLGGMFLLSGQPQFFSDPEWLLGVGGIFIALFSWGYCLIWMKDADLPNSIFQSAALQMFSGGVMMLVISGALGEWNGFKFNNVPASAWYGLGYLVVFGSILAFTAFNYLVTKVSADKVSTSTYVNPVIALFLGNWLNAEVLTERSIVAAILLLTGVLFINGQVAMLVNWLSGKIRG